MLQEVDMEETTVQKTALKVVTTASCSYVPVTASCTCFYGYQKEKKHKLKAK